MFCRLCGTEISEDAAYCGQCGTKVIKPNADNIVGAQITHDNCTRESQSDTSNDIPKTPTWQKWLIGIIVVIILGFGAWLSFLFIRWLFSSFIIAVIVIAVGYVIYHKALAPCLTGQSYVKESKELQLPEGMSASTLLEALSGKFNYPYFKGIHYGTDGKCVIEGKYSMYPVTFYADNITEISYIPGKDDKKTRTILLEAMAIRDYVNKFFNPDLPVDVVKDMKKLKLAEGQRKAVAIVCTAATVLVAAALIWDYVSPGSLQSMAVPGYGVRTAYLSEYSNRITIEEAFDNYFGNGKWSQYDSEGYSYVIFTGTCIYLGKQADIRIAFKITGEHFIVDSLDINGRAQSDLILYGLLSDVYETY